MVRAHAHYICYDFVLASGEKEQLHFVCMSTSVGWDLAPRVLTVDTEHPIVAAWLCSNPIRTVYANSWFEVFRCSANDTHTLAAGN